ncbi:MAG TPA: hypothetical protein VFP61_16220 [Acidimicrobiales bacterium]|nr:hypothetical protein [Acidimicrobiales bacterium]
MVNCDGMHTIEQSSLGGPIGTLPRETLTEVCSAVAYALGC